MNQSHLDLVCGQPIIPVQQHPGEFRVCLYFIKCKNAIVQCSFMASFLFVVVILMFHTHECCVCVVALVFLAVCSVEEKQSVSAVFVLWLELSCNGPVETQSQELGRFL